ncbi:hypothetical protein [Heyndrickxia ginsengihumi]|uniref:hypothetical protein n=1 Tax=Heyndrickxia ginsengihumi TaxID=363870 RepID=UPI003D199661
MARGYYLSKGMTKKKLIKMESVPTKESKERIESWLWDSEVLRVFVDASELKNQGIFGFGVIFVGQGATLVRTKKHYNQAMRKVNVYAEIAAVEFALTQVEEVVGNEFDQPSKILIYSDWNEVDKLKETAMLTKRVPEINAIAKKINEKKLLFTISHPTVELEILYMGDEMKKHNIYHRGAHNFSRKVIGL